MHREERRRESTLLRSALLSPSTRFHSTHFIPLHYARFFPIMLQSSLSPAPPPYLTRICSILLESALFRSILLESALLRSMLMSALFRSILMSALFRSILLNSAVLCSILFHSIPPFIPSPLFCSLHLGESLPVTMYKSSSCKMGSTVVRGETEGTVEFTGANTFFGKTASLLQGDDEMGHLQKV
jgi:hypothetical protein